MWELVAWGLGLVLGYSFRNSLTEGWRIALFGVAILVLGPSITLLSGEMAGEPWLVVVDIGQVGAAALIGAFLLPYGLRHFRDMA